MKFVSIISIIVLSLALSACNKGNEVSGRSMKSAYRSVNHIKNRLPVEQRIEFELSFWALRDLHPDKDEFLDTVGGKNNDEIIALGKEMFQQRKATGFAAYEKYNSWDHMIAKYTKERLNQDKAKSKSVNQRDQANDVLYDL